MFCMDLCSMKIIGTVHQQLHTGGADVGGDVNSHVVKADPDMTALSLSGVVASLATAQLDTEASMVMPGGDQIVNRQASKGDHRKVSGLVEGGAKRTARSAARVAARTSSRSSRVQPAAARAVTPRRC